MLYVWHCELDIDKFDSKNIPDRWHFKSPHSIYESIRASYSKIDEIQSKLHNEFQDSEIIQSARNIVELEPLSNDIFNLKSIVSLLCNRLIEYLSINKNILIVILVKFINIY